MSNQLPTRSPSKTLAYSAAALGAAALLAFTATSNFSFGSGFIAEANAAEGIAIAAPKGVISEPKGIQTAVFAGGCFWGIEGVFEHTRGVVSAESGYSGGAKGDADYEKVSSGRTNHAESVRVRYDPAKISYNQLLHIFFSVSHDPTQKDRQGPDVGRQYRSAIFPGSVEQSKAAGRYIAQLSKSGAWKRPIVTRIEAYSFYPAETYHQDFMVKNPQNSYIRNWDLPKLASLKRLFPKLYR
jgi:peptide-methionine (S)-S-oxide reductase